MLETSRIYKPFTLLLRSARTTFLYSAIRYGMHLSPTCLVYIFSDYTVFLGRQWAPRSYHASATRGLGALQASQRVSRKCTVSEKGDQNVL